jgi:mono/diheme cytochrome c family protein
MNQPTTYTSTLPPLFSPNQEALERVEHVDWSSMGAIRSWSIPAAGNPPTPMRLTLKVQARRSATIRFQLVLTIALSMFDAAGFAQSGDATYKAKCARCHGPAGTPSAGMAKMMGIKPVSDPAIQALTMDQMSAAVKVGKSKMKPIAGLTDGQIKDVVTFYRGLK